MIRVSAALSVSRLDQELVLLDAATGKYYGLNEVGSRIFEFLKETGDPEKVLVSMLAEYEVGEERLRAEISDFVGLLRSKGLVSEDAL